MPLIVVAEDEFLIADMLVCVLEDEGHRVEAAAHGLAALELVRAHKPDLLITDFMMPVMTGLELASALKSERELNSVPILLVSGAQAALGRERADLFDRVIDKPYKLSELLAAVSDLLDADGNGPA
jgi:CheY-like chemotaxis protein